VSLSKQFPTTKHMPEETDPQQQCCENLKSHSVPFPAITVLICGFVIYLKMLSTVETVQH